MQALGKVPVGMQGDARLRSRSGGPGLSALALGRGAGPPVHPERNSASRMCLRAPWEVPADLLRRGVIRYII